MNAQYKQLLLVMGLYFLASFTNATAEEAMIVESYESTYQLKGFRFLEVERTIKLSHSGNDLYVLQSTNTASGLAALAGWGPIIEESRFRFSSGHIWPLTYRNVDKSGMTDIDDAVNFHWENQVAIAKRKQTTVSTPIQVGVLDPLTVVLRVRLDLKLGLRPTVYNVHETDMIRTYHISYLPTETITITGVEFHSVHLVIDTGRTDKILHYWLAPELDYIPIQIKQFYKNKLQASAILIDSSMLP